MQFNKGDHECTIPKIDMKPILIIAYYSPPIYGAESVQINSTVKFLKKYGWNSNIISTGNYAQERLDFELASRLEQSINIYRPYSLKNIVTKIFGTFKLFPDDKVGWIPFALVTINKVLPEVKPKIIYSRSTPVSSHIIAYFTKKKTGLPWVAFFSDPWTENNYVKYPTGIQKKLEEYLERTILKTADKIIVTTEYTRNNFLRKYPALLPDKISVIPNSYDPPQKTRNAVKNRPTEKFIISHIGNIYGKRSPEPLFKALSLMKSTTTNLDKTLEIRFVGHMDQKFKDMVSQYCLEELVKIIDVVPKAEAEKMLEESDALLLIDAPSATISEYLPSKLIEYIFSGKPIIAITQEGASADVIRSTSTGTVINSDDIMSICQTLKIYSDPNLRKQQFFSPNYQEIEKYHAENCAKQLMHVFEELIS